MVNASWDWALQQAANQPKTNWLGVAEYALGQGQGGAYLRDPYLEGIALTQEHITTRFTAEEQRIVDEFNQNLEFLYEDSMRKHDQAISVAQIYGAAQAEAAAEGRAGDEARARATVEAAQIAANAALETARIAQETSKYSDDIKLQIAQETIKLGYAELGLREREIAATELARPGSWIERLGFFRGQTPEQAAAIGEYAQPTEPIIEGEATVLPEPAAPTAPAPEVPGIAAPAAAPMLPSPTTRQPVASPVHRPGTRIRKGMPPAAIVGEAGPELAAMTVSGLQVAPVSPFQAAFLRKKGVPGMQFGGRIGKPQAYRPPSGTRTTTWGPSYGGNLPSATQTRQQRPRGAYTTPSNVFGGGAAGSRLSPSYTGIDVTPMPRSQAPAPQMTAPSISPVASRQPAQTPMLPPAEGKVTIPPMPAPVPVPTEEGTMGIEPWFGKPGYGQPLQEPAVAPPAAGPTPIDQLPFLQAARAGGQYQVAPFQEWTGATTLPQAGITKPVPPPWQYNLQQFQNMQYPEQAALAATWRALNMIAGETEQEQVANAYEAMRRSAWTGGSLPWVTYGGR